MMTSKLQLLKKEYDKVRPAYWTEETRQKLIEDFTYHSNKIEGLQLNYGDTIQFLRTGLIKSNTSAKDIADLSNHRQVLKHIFTDFDNLHLSVESIKLLHGELMKDRVQWGTFDPVLGGPGELKLENNYGTRKGAMKAYMDASIVKDALTELCNKTNEKLRAPGSVVEAINRFHFEFLNDIHPFSDGNGRMARLLHNMLLLKNGYPVVIIDSRSKRQYVDSLIDQEKNPDQRSFEVFMNRTLETTLDSAIKKLNKNRYPGMGI